MPHPPIIINEIEKVKKLRLISTLEKGDLKAYLL